MNTPYRCCFIALTICASATAFAQSPHPFGIPPAEGPNPAMRIQAISGSRGVGWAQQGRAEVIARHGMVATSDPLAAQAGLEMLRNGGNAIDAAVAAAAVLDVTSQNDTGIGGDLFALIWSAKDKRLYGLNAAGWAPAAWTPEYFTATLKVKSVPSAGVNATTVPGAVAGFDAMLKRFGTVGFEAAFERAARIAEEGWGQGETRYSDLRGSAQGLRADPDSARTFLPQGVPPLYGVVRNPELAKALQLLQKQGRDAFYKGEIARAIVAKIKGSGGAMTMSDLAEYEPEWVDPISTNYKGYEVHQLPPPGQGFAALVMLNILEVCVPKHGFDLTALGPSNPMTWHFLVEAKKLAYADLHAFNADPRFSDVPLKRLLSKEYAATLCTKIDPNKAATPQATEAASGGTIYLAAADRWGNMVSLIHSVYSTYGSRVTVPPYGFVLQNRGGGFSLDPKSPNVVAPRKRPFHTIIAGLVTKDGQPLLAFGNMGGSVQPETHAQHIVNLIDHGMNVQMTSDVARFTHNQNTNVLSLETQLFNAVGAALQAKGHEVRTVTGNAVGSYQGILFTRDPTLPEPTLDRRSIREDRPVNGVYRGGSDHRKDGQAVGW